MKIVDIKDIEDCFDGTFIKEVLFDECISKEFIFYLGKDGKMQYFPDFAKPYFQINIKDKYTLKGVEGNKTIRIIFFIDNLEKSNEYFINYIENFKKNS